MALPCLARMQDGALVHVAAVAIPVATIFRKKNGIGPDDGLYVRRGDVSQGTGRRKTDCCCNEWLTWKWPNVVLVATGTTPRHTKGVVFDVVCSWVVMRGSI